MAPSLDNLPYDVYKALEGYITSCADLLRLARCNRRLAAHFVEALYQHATSGPCGQKALFWAVSNTSIGMLRQWIRPRTQLDIIWFFDKYPGNLGDLVRTTKNPMVSCPGALSHSRGRFDPFRDSLAYFKCWPLICVAAATGNVEIIETLLHHGVKTNVGCVGLCDCPPRPRRLGRPWPSIQSGDDYSPTERVWTPLHIALCKGHMDAAKLLASSGSTESMTHEERLNAGQGGQAQPPNGGPGVVTLLGPNLGIDWFGNFGGIEAHPPVMVENLHIDRLPPNCRQYLEPAELGPPGPRPLHGACLAGRLSFLKWVFEESGITLDINRRDAFGHTAIAYAYMYGHWDCVRYLLDKGASINAIVQRRRQRQATILETVLSDAFFHLNVSDLHTLLSLGSEATMMSLNTDDPPRTMLAHICTTSWGLSTDPDSAQNLPHFLELILYRVLEHSNRDGPDFLTTLLPDACQAGNHVVVRRLIENEADVEGPHDAEMTPLLAACKNLNPDTRAETIGILLAHGASPEFQRRDTTPPLWALYHLGGTGEEDETSSQHLAFDMMLRHGAKPYRGTSVGMPYSDNRTVSPLDDLLRKGEWDAFHRLLKRCIDPPIIGDDDILDFWNAVAPSGNGSSMRKIIDADENNINIIARRARSPVQALLAGDPVPRDLVVAMLEKVANPDEQAGMSCLARAIERGVDTALFKMLLDRGAEPRAITASQPVMNHIIAAHKSPLLDDQRRKEFAKLLLDAGVSPYERVRKSMHFSLPDHVPLTNLGHAIYKKTGNQEIVKMFLTREPLGHRQPVEVLRHLELVCRQGHKIALERIITLQDGEGISITFIIMENVLQLIHMLLDNIFGAHADSSEVDAAIGCLQFLLRHAQADMLDEAAPTGSRDARTAREKFMALAVDHGSSAGGKMAVVSGCFRRRMRFKEGDLMPQFTVGGY